MTDKANVEASPSDTDATRPKTWADIAADFAWRMSRPDFQRGDLAELRRMNPDSPDCAAYWRMMAQQDLLGAGYELENKWALILHGIALMTPKGDSNLSAHDGSVSVGRALYNGPESEGGASAYYSQTRLNRLLAARGSMFRVLLARLFRMMGSANASFNWREMARFILNDGYDEDRTERARRRIARDYYSAERRAARERNQESD